jgi:hypothetical protein
MLKINKLHKIKNKKFSYKTVLIIVFLLMVIAIESISIFNINPLKTIPTSPLGSPNLPMKIYAENIVNICKSAPYRPSCYDKEVPKLMDSPINLSMENAFNVTVIIQDLDKSYIYCHILGHELSAKEVDRNPSAWEDVVTRCPANVCSNGCIHGGFQERFRKVSMTKQEVKNIIPQLQNLCEPRKNWSPTGMEKASCYHAVGHLVMYITTADINESLNLCKTIAVKPNGEDYLQLCYDGVFMQIFQPLEPEDFALVKGKQPTKSTLLSFCNKYDKQARASCISESWPLFFDELSTASGIINFCAMETPDNVKRCYQAMFYVKAPTLNFDLDKMEEICKEMPDDVKPICFANMSSRMIETDYRNSSKSVELCVRAGSYGNDSGNQCFNELLFYSKYNFKPDSKEFYDMCNAMPQPWRAKCLN